MSVNKRIARERLRRSVQTRRLENEVLAEADRLGDQAPDLVQEMAASVREHRAAAEPARQAAQAQYQYEQYVREFRNGAWQLARDEFADQWRTMGVPAATAAQWANAGFTPDEAGNHIQAGRNPRDVLDAEHERVVAHELTVRPNQRAYELAEASDSGSDLTEAELAMHDPDPYAGERMTWAESVHASALAESMDTKRDADDAYHQGEISAEQHRQMYQAAEQSYRHELEVNGVVALPGGRVVKAEDAAVTARVEAATAPARRSATVLPPWEQSVEELDRARDDIERRGHDNSTERRAHKIQYEYDTGHRNDVGPARFTEQQAVALTAATCEAGQPHAREHAQRLLDRYDTIRSLPTLHGHAAVDPDQLHDVVEEMRNLGATQLRQRLQRTAETAAAQLSAHSALDQLANQHQPAEHNETTEDHRQHEHALNQEATDEQ